MSEERSAIRAVAFEWEVLARGLAQTLAEQTPLERIDLVCSWATAPEGDLRMAAALALSQPVEVLGAIGCVEHLAADRLPAVRCATVLAARARYAADPRRCRRVLMALASDPVDEVAGEARCGLASLG